MCHHEREITEWRDLYEVDEDEVPNGMLELDETEESVDREEPRPTPTADD